MSTTKAEASAELGDPTPNPKLIGSSKPPAHDVHAAMNFEQLIAKVKQAEDALEAQERRFTADVRQFKSSFKAMWTPGRIVIAGLVSGFVMGRAEPFKLAGKGGSMMQMMTMVTGLFATGSAQVAAKEASDAADSTDAVAETVAGPAAVAQAKAHLGRTEPDIRAPEPAGFVAPVD